MNFLIYLVVGGIAGWLASLVMGDYSHSVLRNILVGIIGGFVGGWMLPQLGFAFGAGTTGFLITSFIGACVFLLILNLISSGRARR